MQGKVRIINFIGTETSRIKGLGYFIPTQIVVWAMCNWHILMHPGMLHSSLLPGYCNWPQPLQYFPLSLPLWAKSCRTNCFRSFVAQSLRNVWTAWNLFNMFAINAISCTTLIVLWYFCNLLTLPLLTTYTEPFSPRDLERHYLNKTT